MIIGVTGFGATGASAYVDLIKEFGTVQSYNDSIEFQLLQQSDGVLDLQYALVFSQRRLHTNTALKRFEKNIKNIRNSDMVKATKGRFEKISSEYLNELIYIAWNGKSAFDSIDIKGKIDKIQIRYLNAIVRRGIRCINKSFIWPPAQKRYFSFLDSQNFQYITKKYLNNIFIESGFDITKPILIEQVFNTSNPTDGMEFFESPYSIIVDRDPRDIYIHVYELAKGTATFMPYNGGVQEFVKYYKMLHNKREVDSRVLYVNFEDLVFAYEDTCKQLVEFLELEHTNKNLFFKPEYSVNNTQLYKKYPKYKDDISYIEKELKNYLYPFDIKK